MGRCASGVVLRYRTGEVVADVVRAGGFVGGELDWGCRRRKRSC